MSLDCSLAAFARPLPHWIDTRLAALHKSFVKRAAMSSKCDAEVKRSVPKMGQKLLEGG